MAARKTELEGARTDHPSDDSWRADALARSHHTRWIEELRQPLEDHDPEKAAQVCAAVARAALRDFAPALLLLGPSERLRARALAAYALTLFDFAAQPGLEGERLAQINRLEFDLEAALGGQPRGQPVYVLMAEAAPWRRDALDQVGSSARSRVAQPRPANERAAAGEAEQLGAALTEALTDGRAEGVTPLAAALLRLAGLLGLAEGVRRRRPRLSREALPDDWLRDPRESPQLDEAIRAECRAIESRLEEVELRGLSRTERRAARYLKSAARRLARAAAEAGARLLERPPELGPAARVALLVRSFVV